jgi:hypothetical protein
LVGSFGRARGEKLSCIGEIAKTPYSERWRLDKKYLKTNYEGAISSLRYLFSREIVIELKRYMKRTLYKEIKTNT